LHVSCRPYLDDGADAWDGRVTDVSCVGLRLIASRRLEGGMVLRLRVKGAPAEMPSLLLVRVLHVNDARGGEWVMGCRVVAALNEEALEILLHESKHLYVLKVTPDPRPRGSGSSTAPSRSRLRTVAARLFPLAFLDDLSILGL
jgi:hypothetical protein